MSENVISVVAALIRDEAGRVLLVRKRGTKAFMQPGGKRDSGESDLAARSREIVEELGYCVDQRTARALGVFDCASANEPGFALRAAVYAVAAEGPVAPQAEIDQIVWVDPRALPDLPLAPMTRDHVLPLAR
jgi:8-oxo-dGTP diphosphatase